MPDDFDPYYQWLGISPKYRPPTHYRLLGLERFEDHPDVISSAADQRMAHVRSLQSGPRKALSQQILNELSAARLCLLNAESKRNYDAKLREQLAAEQAAAAGVDAGAAAPPAEEGWTRDLAADVKAASRFASLEAERVKLVQFTRAEAYRNLGAEIRRDGLLDDDFVDQLALIALAEARVAELQGSERSASGLASKVMTRAQLETAQRKLHGLLAKLGETAYAQHGGASGPRQLTARIATLEKRLSEIDAELAGLEQSRSGRLVGPKTLAAAAAGAVVLVLATLLFDSLRSVALIAMLAGAGYAAYRYYRRK